MITLQTIVNRVLGMNEHIKTDKKIKTLNAFKRFIDKAKNNNSRIKKEDNQFNLEEYIELIEKYFLQFTAEKQKSLQDDEIEKLAGSFEWWGSLIENVNKEYIYNRKTAKDKYNIEIKETADIVSKDTLFFLMLNTRCYLYSYKWITLYLNLLNIAVNKPFLEILRVSIAGEVEAMTVPVMSKEELKKVIDLYNHNRKCLIKNSELKDEMIKALNNNILIQVFKNIDNQVKESYVIDNYVIDRYYNKEK